MDLVFLGPPGAGKGTQAKLTAKAAGARHISTGDLLRKEMRDGTERGLAAKSFVNDGKLVPDELVDSMVATTIADDSKAGFLLDGYPRNIGQAAVLDANQKELGRKIDAVVNLEVPDDAIESRLTGRRLCPNRSCGAMYHITNEAPKTEGICDNCGEKLIVRSDDQPEVIRERLEVYHRETEPLIEYYAGRDLVRTIPGVGITATCTPMLEVAQRLDPHSNELV